MDIGTPILYFANIILIFTSPAQECTRQSRLVPDLGVAPLELQLCLQQRQSYKMLAVILAGRRILRACKLEGGEGIGMLRVLWAELQSVDLQIGNPLHFTTTPNCEIPKPNMSVVTKCSVAKCLPAHFIEDQTQHYLHDICAVLGRVVDKPEHW